MKKTWIVILMFLAILLAPMMEVFGKDKDKNDESIASNTILIMTSAPGGKETNEFNCSENEKVRIYVDFTFEAEKGSNHTLEAFWIGPNGKQQAYKEYKVSGNSTLIWLDLPKKKVGMFELEGVSYIKEWKLKIRVDRELAGKKVFYIAC